MGWQTGVALVWLVAAWQFQARLLNPSRSSERIVFAWAAMEIALLTALLCFPGIDGPQSSLKLVYILLLAGAALRGGPSLILFVYQLTLAGYLCLVLYSYLHPEFLFASRLGCAIARHTSLPSQPFYDCTDPIHVGAPAGPALRSAS